MREISSFCTCYTQTENRLWFNNSTASDCGNVNFLPHESAPLITLVIGLAGSTIIWPLRAAIHVRLFSWHTYRRTHSVEDEAVRLKVTFSKLSNGIKLNVVSAAYSKRFQINSILVSNDALPFLQHMKFYLKIIKLLRRREC